MYPVYQYYYIGATDYSSYISPDSVLGRLYTDEEYFTGRDFLEIKKKQSDNYLLFDYIHLAQTNFLLRKYASDLFNLYKTTWEYNLYLKTKNSLSTYQNQTGNFTYPNIICKNCLRPPNPDACFMDFELIIDTDNPVTEITIVPDGIVNTVAKLGGLFAVFRFIAIL